MKRTILLVAILAVAGAVPASADVVISTDATQNMSCSGGACAPTASDAVLNVTDLENLLASGNVSVVTTNGSVQANNIDITAPFSWNSARGLTLDAWQSITFSADASDAGKGAVSLVTNDGGKHGALTFAVGQGTLDFASSKSPLSINGKNYKLVTSVKALAVAIFANPDGNFALSEDTDAGKDGLYYNPPIPVPFGGAFNGLGHAISKLEIDNVGLFVDVKKSGSLASVALRNVTVQGGGTDTGSLAVENDGTVTNSFASGSVSGKLAGGLIARNLGTITGSQAAVSVSGGTGGGLVGYNGGTVTLSFASGKISGKYVGGLVGDNYGPVENCYAFGAAANGGSKNSLVGGFVAGNGEPISTSYSIGAVGGTGEGTLVGGFDGKDQGSIANSYWDTDTSGNDQGSGDGNETGLTGLTTKQFQSGLPSGFDPAIWAEDAGINNGFPYLIANPPAK